VNSQYDFIESGKEFAMKKKDIEINY